MAKAKGITLPVQRQMVQAMLTTKEGMALFPLLGEMDMHVFEEQVQDTAVRRVVESLRRYYAKFRVLPSKEAWRDWRGTDKPLVQWLKNCADDEEESLQGLEAAMYAKPKDAAFAADRLAGFLSESFLQVQMQVTAMALATGSATASEEISRMQVASRSFQATMKTALEGHGIREVSEITSKPDLRGLGDTTALETFIPSLRLYRRGLTVLLAGPKSWKTGAVQAVTTGLASEGAWVYYIDLENGEAKMRRRFYQGIIGCTKHELFAGKVIDPAALPHPQPEKGKWYGKGDLVCKVVPVQDDEGDWHFEATTHEALANGAESKEDWSEGEEADISEALSPAAGKIEEALAAFKGRLMLEYVKAATIDRIETVVVPFFAEAPPDVPKVLVIDWGRHLLNPNGKLSHWEKVRDNYAALKALRDEHDLHVLMIEAPADYGKMSDPNFKISNLKVAGTEQIGFDVESMAVMLFTEEEGERGYRRIITKEDRDAEKGEHTVQFLKIDHQRMTAKVITKEEHREACPEFWAARDGGGGSGSSSGSGGDAKGRSKIPGLKAAFKNAGMDTNVEDS